MLVKILGTIDVICAIVLLSAVFGINPLTPILLGCAVLLFLKGLFILQGDLLSIIDIIASLIFVITIFFTLPTILLWVPSFLLLAKGIVSFL